MFPRLCRVCGGSELLKNIEGKDELLELLQVCANITVSNDDLLPKLICQQCELGLQFSFRLRKQGEETEKRLRLELESQNDAPAVVMNSVAAKNEFTLASQVQQLSRNGVVIRKMSGLIEPNDLIQIDVNPLNKQVQLPNINLHTIKHLDELEFQPAQPECELDTFATTACNEYELATQQQQSEDCTILSELECPEESEQVEHELIEEILDSDDEPQIVENYEASSIENVLPTNNTHNVEDDDDVMDDIVIIEESNGEYENAVCTDEAAVGLNDANTAPGDVDDCVSVSSYICVTCQTVLPNQREYRKHIKIHGDERFPCPECNKWFPTQFRLQKHQRIHLGYVEQHMCNICERSYNVRSNLYRHIREAHGASGLMCFKCGEIFGRSDVLKAHMARHEEEVFNCDECTESFKSKRLLSAHKRKHAPKIKVTNKNTSTSTEYTRTPGKTYYCSYCGKESKHLFTHKNHLLIHTQERPHKCDTCGKPFRTLAALMAHERIHVDARPYQCEHCLLSFRQSSHLKEHKMIHDGITPHVCTICNLSFTKKNNMLVHMRIHSGEKPYKCTKCGEQFTKRATLRHHAISVHGIVSEIEPDPSGQQNSLAEKGAVVNNGDDKMVLDVGQESNLNIEDDDIIEVDTRLNDCDDDLLSGSAFDTNFSNDFGGSYADDAAVVLIVDDDAKFNSLFIMDD